MPTVLRIITRLNLGGPARHVVRVHGPLAERGWRTHLVTGRVEPGEPDLTHEAREAGLSLTVLPSLGRVPHPLRDGQALASLIKIVRAVRPDVVHTHTAKAGVLGRLAGHAVRPRPALVHTFHGHVLAGTLGPLASACARRAERVLARRTDRLVAVSRRVRDDLVGTHRVGRLEQYAVVPPGIDPERTAVDVAGGRALRRAWGVDDDEVLVGCLGRLEPVKDVGRLLDAWERLGPARRRARLLVMGDGRDAAWLRSRLDGVPSAFWQPPRARLGAVYGALDVLVLSSLGEGLPQTVVEARRAGVPVVAAAVGGVPELVRDGRDGRLVPPRDTAALARALAETMADDVRRASMGEAARRRSWSAHHPEAVASALADVYAACCGMPLETGAASGHAASLCASSS